LQNTSLLQAYANVHPSVREFILAVKTWAKAANVCGATEGKLSCYTFTLMAIYYLQVDWLVNLPCLPTKAFALGCEKLPADLHQSWTCPATLSLLLDRFFMFYAEIFGWGHEVVSVRLGRRVEASSSDFSTLSHREGNWIHIEDPFDLKRNLNCVLGPNEERELRAAFAEASALVRDVVSSLKQVHTVAPKPEPVGGRMSPSGAGAGPVVAALPVPARRKRDRRHEEIYRNENTSWAPTGQEAPVDEDWKWYFAFAGSCCIYTVYAMYCGQLFRLAIALSVLVVVLFAVERPSKPIFRAIARDRSQMEPGSSMAAAQEAERAERKQLRKQREQKENSGKAHRQQRERVDEEIDASSGQKMNSNGVPDFFGQFQ
jgi:hypothetical protein